MIHRNRFFYLVAFLMPFILVIPRIVSAQETGKTVQQAISGQVQVLNRDGNPIHELTDGNKVTLRILLDNPSISSSHAIFQIGETQIADCVIPNGRKDCTSEPIYSLGWYWDINGTSAPQRSLRATIDDNEVANIILTIKPRPVVMIHGFVSSWIAWTNYLGPLGFLAKEGIAGFAVGDGQVEGVMNTGSLDNPSGRTNTIHQNAEIVGNYIQQVKQRTGAEMVDLLAHSMGGLIAREYISHIMPTRDVGQLIMLGSPMAGTDCADLPASLGLYLPATLELRPSYVVGIFNPNATERHGIAFHALAGNPIQDAFKSPCTSVPSDIAVSLGSVTAIPLQSAEMSILHQDLNISDTVFADFVAPLLKNSTEHFSQAPLESQASAPEEPLQFTRVFTGHIGPAESSDVLIHIEQGVVVASFALYDTSRTLTLTVRGASGNVIDLTSDKNGLVVVNDPSSLFYLGYGFNDPKPGVWRVTLAAAPTTPADGADYAITAYMVGGAVITASVDPIIPKMGDSVSLKANLEINQEPIQIEFAQAAIRKPDNSLVTVNLDHTSNQADSTWKPDMVGIYAVDLNIKGVLSDGTSIERTSFLSFEVQPEEKGNLISLNIIIPCIIGIGFIAFVVLFVLLFIRWKKK